MRRSRYRQLSSRSPHAIVWRGNALVALVTCAVALGAGLSSTMYATGTMATAGQGARTTADGVFTAEQAARGRDSYLKECASCHAENLQGGDEAPGLVGSGFLSQWVTLSADQLFERTRTTMPQDGPGRLSRAMYADVLAHIFRVNGFPAGSAEFPSDAEALKAITIQEPVRK
jgi:mono/diheme cytochrome c family protein